MYKHGTYLSPKEKNFSRYVYNMSNISWIHYEQYDTYKKSVAVNRYSAEKKITKTLQNGSNTGKQNQDNR